MGTYPSRPGSGNGMMGGAGGMMGGFGGLPMYGGMPDPMSMLAAGYDFGRLPREFGCCRVCGFGCCSWPSLGQVKMASIATAALQS
jgi:hypothetical protein